MQTRYQHVLTKEIYTLDEIAREVYCALIKPPLSLVRGERRLLPTRAEALIELKVVLGTLYEKIEG